MTLSQCRLGHIASTFPKPGSEKPTLFRRPQQAKGTGPVRACFHGQSSPSSLRMRCALRRDYARLFSAHLSDESRRPRAHRSMGRIVACRQCRNGIVLLAPAEARAGSQHCSTRPDLRLAIVTWAEKTNHRKRHSNTRESTKSGADPNDRIGSPGGETSNAILGTRRGPALLQRIESGHNVSTIQEQYAEELDARLAEWQSGSLEPPFRFADMRTLLAITIALPVVGLIVGWFL